MQNPVTLLFQGAVALKIHENWWTLCSIRRLEDEKKKKLYVILTQTADVLTDMKSVLRGSTRSHASKGIIQGRGFRQLL